MLWPNFQDTQQGTKNTKDDANTATQMYDTVISFLVIKEKLHRYTDVMRLFYESKDNCGRWPKKNGKKKIAIPSFLKRKRLEIRQILHMSPDM